MMSSASAVTPAPRTAVQILSGYTTVDTDRLASKLIGAPVYDGKAKDANNLGSSLGGDPLTILSLFSDTPRALAVSPNGERAYAAAFHSGNRTSTVHEILVPNGGESVGGVPGPNVNFEGKPAPETGVLASLRIAW